MFLIIEIDDEKTDQRKKYIYVYILSTDATRLYLKYVNFQVF